MNYEKLAIEGLAIITPKRHEDNRGYFCETFRENWFQDKVANVKFVQENLSFSRVIGTIRGLHFQKEPRAQAKLIRVLKGAVFDVAVDIRKNSKTFGKYISVMLDAAEGKQFFIPEGFAHGFCSLQSDTILAYKVTQYYAPEYDAGIAFDDNDIGITWPIEKKNAILSNKDLNLPTLKSLV